MGRFGFGLGGCVSRNRAATLQGAFGNSQTVAREGAAPKSLGRKASFIPYRSISKYFDYQLLGFSYGGQEIELHDLRIALHRLLANSRTRSSRLKCAGQHTVAWLVLHSFGHSDHVFATQRQKLRRDGKNTSPATGEAKIEIRTVLGLSVPVMERSALIAYKELAGRETDLIDISEI